MTANKIIVEVCAFNVQSCMVAEKAGAQRIELCASPPEGGTTPSYGAIKQAREKVSISLYPIIRPRGGYFVFDEEDLEIMKKDIQMCQKLGCDGISVGVQKPSGEIDVEKMKRIAGWAYPLGVTCHRAFDLTPDPFQALEDLIACGCERVLTSGQQKSCIDGMPLIAQLVKAAADRICIMPGAGVRAANILTLIRNTTATEYHTSARKILPHPLPDEEDILALGDMPLADETELSNIMHQINSLPFSG